MNGKHVLVAAVLEVHVNLAAALEGHRLLGSTVAPSTFLVNVVLEEEVMAAKVEYTPTLLPSL